MDYLLASFLNQFKAGRDFASFAFVPEVTAIPALVVAAIIPRRNIKPTRKGIV
jgi:hypothetical protein